MGDHGETNSQAGGEAVESLLERLNLHEEESTDFGEEEMQDLQEKKAKWPASDCRSAHGSWL